MKQPKHIVIVEDDHWQGEVYQDILERYDFVVTVCPDGQRAVEVIDQQLPHAIILDMMLPGSNGIAFLHELKSYEDSATIPVIVCTATQLSPAFRRALTHYGVHVVLDKAEVAPEQLANLLKEVTYTS